jgi:hypothetical protein
MSEQDPLVGGYLILEYDIRDAPSGKGLIKDFLKYFPQVKTFKQPYQELDFRVERTEKGYDRKVVYRAEVLEVED